MDMNTTEINHLEKIRKTPLSLEAPFSVRNGDNSLIDIIVDEKTVDPIARLKKEDLKKELAKALSFLSSRERKILILRFGLKNDRRYTLNEVGKIMAVSRERIRQVQNIALRRLRWRNPQLRELLE